MSRLLITRLEGKICTALVSGGRVLQMSLDPPQGEGYLNNIYVGRVQKVVPNINAAFVEFQRGQIGYYSLSENQRHRSTDPARRQGTVKAGDELLVQVARDAVKTKAPVLTSCMSLPGRFCVLTAGRGGLCFSSRLTREGCREELRGLFEAQTERPWRGEDPLGVIIRTNAEDAAPERVLAEYQSLCACWERMKEEAAHRTCFSCLYQAPPSYIAGIRDARMESLEAIVTDEPELYAELSDYLNQSQQEDAEKLELYQDPLLPLRKCYRLERELSRALEKRVWLKSGGYLVIEPTEAMVVIDVNTGKYSGKKRQADTIRQINREAAEEIGRQLRLRNLSGIILIDFIDMERDEDRMALLEYMRGIAAGDPVPAAVVEMTKLNLVELTRKKVKRPLYEQVMGETKEQE